ncbi:MAG: DUF1902 domain-containing protein [Methylobacterium sp.]|uniref:DUF1902 domain-containing protein n=1 Tax=Methylobacterium sp. TaxID=409 RepID=UPI0025DFD092|nr:DUF1902 domain-containing protein [Methylobacterium sp.]MBX9930926.1 DUF1902 domain-containing protein [Methylobacterium sp.]
MIRDAAIGCSCDDEARVWFVEETDIPGLVTEAPTLDALRLKLLALIQDLLDLDAPAEIEIDLIAHAHSRVRVEAASRWQGSGMEHKTLKYTSTLTLRRYARTKDDEYEVTA